MEKTLRKWCVYKHTSPSGKVYIGITSNNPLIRWGKRGQNYKDNRYFNFAIQKYGWDSFTHEILYTDLVEEDAKSKEIELIAYYQNLNMCYNINPGGDLGSPRPMSENTKKKLSVALKGHCSYPRTKEWRKHMSELMKQHPTFTEEGREKAHTKCKEILSKEVVQMDLSYHIICIYTGVREASRVTGFDYSGIAKCCRGKYYKTGHQGYGYIWKYKKDLNYGKTDIQY